MNRRTLLSLPLGLLLVACASTKPTLYDISAINAVKLWTVDFTYEAGRTERAASAEKGAEIKVVTEGHPRRDLKLRDDIAFSLKDEYKLDASRAKRAGSGSILLLPVSFSSGGFQSLDVEIQLPDGTTAGRIQIKNGDRNATFKNDTDFAEYATTAIAVAMRGGK